jgi:hypothetical protein
MKNWHQSGGCMINAPKWMKKWYQSGGCIDKCNQSGWKNGTKVEDALINVTKVDEKMAPKWRMH